MLVCVMVSTPVAKQEPFSTTSPHALASRILTTSCLVHFPNEVFSKDGKEGGGRGGKGGSQVKS